jgi:signal transduction histidine kinase
VLSSLTNRIFVASALLVVIATGAAMYFVERAVSRRAEGDLTNGLNEAVSLVDAVSRTQFGDFLVKAQLVANLPVLNGATATGDPPTVQPIAEENQQLLRADVFIVIGRGDRILAEAGGIELPAATVAAVLTACRARADRTVFWPLAGSILHLVAIPLEAGTDTLLAGTKLDREAADAIKAATQADIVFLSGTSVVAGTLDLGPAPRLEPVPGQAGVFLVPAGHEQYIGRLQPRGAGGRADDPRALVLRSRSELTRFLRRLRWQLVGTAAAAILVATLVGYVVARTVTRPLRALTSTMQDIAATGDLGRALPAIGPRDDEDVRVVAAAFGRLTSALDRFQREASARERLTSLGRLSAVIAHEIRNPLMIIKSSARALRHHPSPEVTAAARSIDEEVGRVNRVVTGVLDFARPITFAVARANLRDICLAAIQAAEAGAGAGDVPITLDMRSDGGTIVTDAERLRLVLVNLLTNAQQAMRAAPAADRARAAVRLRVSVLASDGWRLEVSDEGPGIAADHLARIFDPFFTTRDTGAGLGLAISRNIIEGLGGTIEAASRTGGTTMTVVLPGPGTRVEGRT